jgi:hypothetical protein
LQTSTTPATLAINEEQAEVVRLIFEMFASGNYGLVTSRATSKNAVSLFEKVQEKLREHEARYCQLITRYPRRKGQKSSAPVLGVDAPKLKSEAEAKFDSDKGVIYIGESTYRAAEKGEEGACWTIAHEVGHLPTHYVRDYTSCLHQLGQDNYVACKRGFCTLRLQLLAIFPTAFCI